VRGGPVLLFLVLGGLLAIGPAVVLLEHYDTIGEVGDDTTFRPRRPGVLTVATSFPSAGFWEGPDVDHVTGGMERDLARELADRFDLDRVEVVHVPFDELVGGHAHGFDLALSQISVTEQREADVQLSETYLTTPVGVVGRAGTSVPDLAAARDLRWGEGRATTLADLVDDRVRPKDDPRLYPSTNRALDALADGEVDLVAVDYARALAEVAAHDTLVLVAQIDAPQYYGALLPKDSPNLDAVNAAIRELRADGTLEELRHELDARFDVDPDTVPTIHVPD
jgi:polar amino acid transport system substrate-binding protein